MKLLMFGKTRTVTRLTEEAAEDFAWAGAEVRLIPYRDAKWKKTLEPLLMAPALGVPLAAQIARQMRAFDPDLVLGIGPFHWLPAPIFQRLAAAPGRPPLAAWIGDRFGPQDKPIADLFDLIGYTDTGLMALHQEYGFKAKALYLPLAARLGAAVGPDVDFTKDRDERLVFVASATPHRRQVLGAIDRPIALYGRDFADKAGLEQHDIHPIRVDQRALSGLYRRHGAVLNIRHELNVINGLNQRHFAPYVEGAAVVSDEMGDLAAALEPGVEVLTYRDGAELNALAARLGAEPDLARRIARAGHRRVLAEHTYRNRLQTLATAAGVRFA